MATTFTTRSILLSVFAVFVVLGPCVALECYYCFPDADDTCADPFNTTQAATMECPFNNSMCTTLEFGGNFTRGCVSSDSCTTQTCLPEICFSCCDDEDLCNGRPLVPPVNTTFCYLCSYMSDTGEDAACKDEPFDPNGAGVHQIPCDGDCNIITASQNGNTGVFRGCSPGNEPCVSGCNTLGLEVGCQSCCKGNLCNDGPPPSLQPSTPAPPPLQSSPAITPTGTSDTTPTHPPIPTGDTTPTHGQGVATSPPDVGLPSPTSQGPALAPDVALVILGIAALYLAAS